MAFSKVSLLTYKLATEPANKAQVCWSILPYHSAIAENTSKTTQMETRRQDVFAWDLTTVSINLLFTGGYWGRSVFDRCCRKKMNVSCLSATPAM